MPKDKSTEKNSKAKDPKDAKGVRGGRVISTRTESLPVVLNDQELLIAGAQLAAAERAARTHEVESAAFKSQLNSEKKNLDKRLRERSKVVESKTEERDVLIQVEEDKDKRFALEFRLDTDPPTLITRRPLTDQERQCELPLKDESAKVVAELAQKAIKDDLDAEGIRKLAETKKVPADALLKAVTDAKNKVIPLKDVSKDKPDAAARVAEKLWVAGVRSGSGKAKIEEAAKDVGLTVEELTEALQAVEKRIEKPEQK